MAKGCHRMTGEQAKGSCQAGIIAILEEVELAVEKQKLFVLVVGRTV